MKPPPKTICDALDELYEEFEYEGTKLDVTRACRYCMFVLPHTNQFGLWVAIKHAAHCGLNCLGGGVDAGLNEFHSDKCPRCYP